MSVILKLFRYQYGSTMQTYSGNVWILKQVQDDERQTPLVLSFLRPIIFKQNVSKRMGIHENPHK